jgi:hypothetical protein
VGLSSAIQRKVARKSFLLQARSTAGAFPAFSVRSERRRFQVYCLISINVLMISLKGVNSALDVSGGATPN